MTAIGFIGLGTMGGPMCARLAGAGYSVRAFDISADAMDVAVAGGAGAAASAVDAATGAEVLFTSLPAPAHVEAVMAPGDGDGALAALSSGSIWVDLTTSRPDLIRRLADEAPDGVDVVDSPVTGAVDGARNGALTLFAGGDPSTITRVRPALEHLGSVVECGDLGAGCVVKLVTNQLWFVGAAALVRHSRSASRTACSSATCGKRSSTASPTASWSATMRRASLLATTTLRFRSPCA